MGKKLYVGNIPFSATEDSLRDAFSSFGVVESSRIITDRDTGRSKGFGFIEMGTDEEAETAIQNMNGAELDGRPLKVNEAKPQAPRNDNGRRPGGRNRY
ncbi:MAG: RNA-binding protein [Bdellovibrionaceae bacterium]|nr:RNA-binding protein [Pseudobdellovibrionaceae bacterium]|tara:strand:+ start:2510 stop:2806 length:297 start_codon:yes stop_codon:yes gene_type:complete